MLVWVILALAVVLLFLRVREGLDEKEKQNPDMTPQPHNAMPCVDWDKKMKSKAKDMDFRYCRGFNSMTCGDMEASNAVTPCPAGYAVKSSLDIQMTDEASPMEKKNALGM
jgi:hypothetical protein